MPQREEDAPSLLGVAGWPVGHSRSPQMHNAALAELGLDWLYMALPLPPEHFGEVVPALAISGFRGINVTVPHKEAAAALADERSEAAEAIGAANTLTFADGGIAAENTDAGGFLDALGESPRGKTALVLGAGGSARAVVWALLEAGAAEVSIFNRTAARARDLAGALGARYTDRPFAAELMVNCTTIGLDPATSERQGVQAAGLEGLPAPAVFVDLVYGSSPPALERWAEDGGSRTVGGLEVLVRQGARSLELWTGRPAPVGVMRAAARGD